MPHLESVRRDFADRGVRGFALNIWEDGDPIAYLSEHSIGLKHVPLAEIIAEDYGVKGTPSVFVIDHQGKVVYQRRKGEKPEDVEAAVRAALEQALAQAAAH